MSPCVADTVWSSCLILSDSQSTCHATVHISQRQWRLVTVSSDRQSICNKTVEICALSRILVTEYQSDGHSICRKTTNVRCQNDAIPWRVHKDLHLTMQLDDSTTGGIFNYQKPSRWDAIEADMQPCRMPRPRQGNLAGQRKETIGQIDD
jgi:hypothetical protein